MPPRTVKPKPSPTAAAPSTPDGTSDINLRVLKRDDAGIESIIAHSKHAVLYRFDAASRQWARKNVEGALFVVSRVTEPRYAFVVLNRCGTENLTQAIGGEGFEVEPSVPYLMYKIGSEVNGIWFHDQSECESMTEVFEDLTASARAAPPATSSMTTSVKHGLEALFASASSISPSADHNSSPILANDAAAPSSSAPIRILQAPRNLVGASATRVTKIKSVAATAAPAASTVAPPAVTSATIKAALLELASDDAFTQRIARAISKHSA